MPKLLSIFRVEAANKNESTCSSELVRAKNVKKRKPTYGGLMQVKNMYLICLMGVWCGILQCSGVFAEFPGLRKPPINWVQNDEKDDNLELLSRIRAFMMENNARNKLMQQLEQLTRENELIDRQKPFSMEDGSNTDVGMSEFLDRINSNMDASKMNTQFAYTPQDQRYWIPEPIKLLKPFKTDMAEYESAGDDELPIKIKQETLDGVPTFNVKAPMIPNPKLQSTKQGTIDNNNNNNKNNNQQEVQQQQQEQTGTNQKQQQSVVQKPMKLDDGIGIYVVAMIAGVSAAVTVAVIAVGLGWYTLRQKIKAAADVDYPAYGVTGPNKDLLYPSGDKKFAQSVDIYHYQQQKQKKLSLENKSNGETNDGFSDLDDGFDMDDGDYTVYECPGFAPTGEMEVKNPLFADEPITVAQKHQPSSEATEDVTQMVETSNEKRSPNNNKQATKKSPKNISPNKEKSKKK